VRAAITAALLLALFAGCRSADRDGAGRAAAESASAAPNAIRKVGEVVLRETDSLFVAGPIGLTIGGDGSLYVSDNIEHHVVRFGRTGEPTRTYGRPGQGPGELQAPSRLGLVGDSVLLVADNRRGQVTAYDVASGQYLYDIAVTGTSGAISARHDTVWLGLRHFGTQTGVATWSARDRTPRHIVDFPASYKVSRQVATVYSYVQVLPLGDSLLVSYFASPDLLLTDLDGRVWRTMRIPVVRRRAIPADVERRYYEARSRNERASLVPLLAVSHRLSSGTLALVSYDIDWPGQVTLRRAWVILLSPDPERACLDLPLPLTRDGTGNVAFHGDTLVTLEQEVHGQGVRLVSRRYVVDEGACTWQPLTPTS
jgi:hypothetical protein